MSLIAGDRNLTDYPSGAKDKGYAVIVEDEKKVLNIFRYHEESGQA